MDQNLTRPSGWSRKDGFTAVSRASDSELLRSLVAEGDLPGNLWKHWLKVSGHDELNEWPAERLTIEDVSDDELEITYITYRPL